jgi:DNA-binding transcriptional regulator YhcF (GntR family)
MEFDQPKGIYLQIADEVCDRILTGECCCGERIPSIRELAVNLGVNPNTVTRSYQSLLDRHIIENRRGIGYFVTDVAKQHILEERRAEFIRSELPKLFRAMQFLGLDMEALKEYYEKFNQEVAKHEPEDDAKE